MWQSRRREGEDGKLSGVKSRTMAEGHKFRERERGTGRLYDLPSLHRRGIVLFTRELLAVPLMERRRTPSNAWQQHSLPLQLNRSALPESGAVYSSLATTSSRIASVPFDAFCGSFATHCHTSPCFGSLSTHFATASWRFSYKRLAFGFSYRVGISACA